MCETGGVQRRSGTTSGTDFVVRVALAIFVALLLAGCGTGDRDRAHGPASGASAPSRVALPRGQVYRDATWQFAIDVPAGWAIQHDFESSYLANGTWKTYAGPQSQGTPVVALVVPDSNRITDAEIRIGVSRSAAEVSRCTTPPDAARAGSQGHEMIGGLEFVTFAASDAGMSHHLDVHGYRVVHDGACYAIDLLVYGVNPQVFDPPATPPFSREQAFTLMHPVVESFRFTQ
jgi:hypothetical protein